jgi:hypothetical protein
MNRLILAALLIATAFAPAMAKDAEPKAPRERFEQLVVYGNDPCPQSTEEQINVCARLPENERYRIPKRFRDVKKDTAAGRAWGDRVQTLEMVSRMGRPNSCSPVGSNGQTGCFQQFLHQAYEERQLEKSQAVAP